LKQWIDVINSLDDAIRRCHPEVLRKYLASNKRARSNHDVQAADGKEFTGYGLFAAVSFDDGKTWPTQRLITPGGAERTVSGVDKNEFTLSHTMAEPSNYLAACPMRDERSQLISSKNHYVFYLAWLKDQLRRGSESTS